MTSRNGLPQRGPGERRTLGDNPQLSPRRGLPLPHQREDATAAEVFPGPEAEGTIKTANVGTPAAFQRALGAPPTVAEGEQPPLPNLQIPETFEELRYHAILLNPAREVSVVVEQTIAPGASGSTTVAIPAGVVDVARTFREGGDGSVSYRIEVDGAGRTAMAQHRVTGAERTFARFFEKFTSVIVSFTNNDPVNPALLQVEWVSLQIDSAKWQRYRDNMRAWARLLGIEG